MKGLSIPVALLIMLILFLAILIPAFIIFNQLNAYSAQGNIQGSIYQNQQEYQNEQVFKGDPNIYYNASPSQPSLVFTYNSIPTPFNLSKIYYFDGTQWVPVQTESITIDGYIKYPLPTQVAGYPIIIVTSLGNVYFLNPNTSVVTVTISQGQGKIPIYISAYVKNGSKLIPVSILVTLQSSSGGQIISGLTPQIFTVTPGSYLLDDVNGSIIYLSSYGLTAKFLNWSLIGYGSLTYPDKLDTQFDVYGPLVITAVYNASLEKFKVTIMPNNLPLGENITSQYNGETLVLSAVNKTIPVTIDNKVYYINSSGLTLTLTYGYHIIEFPSYYNITFNYTLKQGSANSNKILFNVSYGQINCYEFTGLSSSTSKISVISGNTIFVNGSGTVYGNYQQYQTYYLVIVKNDFILPPGCTLDSNTSPVLGDIAGEQLQINGVYTWGPIKNFVPQEFYVKAGTTYEVTYDYLHPAPYGKYVVSGTCYVSLLSYPWFITIYSSTYYYGQTYYLEGNTQPGISFTANSPLIIINGEEWLYGGTQSPNQWGGGF